MGTLLVPTSRHRRRRRMFMVTVLGVETCFGITIVRTLLPFGVAPGLAFTLERGDHIEWRLGWCKGLGGDGCLVVTITIARSH